MAYWLHCQSCMQWSKSATGLSEDKSCPFCDNHFWKTKPYSIPNNAVDTELLNEKETPIKRPEKVKTSDGQSVVEKTAIVSNTHLQEGVEEQEFQEAPQVVYQKPETAVTKDMPKSLGINQVYEATETSTKLQEKTEKRGNMRTEVAAQSDTQLSEMQEKGNTSPIDTVFKHELASNQDAVEAELKEDEEAVDVELENDEAVFEEEREEDEEFACEVQETNDAQINLETCGHSETQELPETEQIYNKLEQAGMSINFIYDKSESQTKPQKAEFSDIPGQSSDSPIVAEAMKPATYEMSELSEKYEDSIDWELEEDEDVGEVYREEDKEVACEAAETPDAQMEPETHEMLELPEKYEEAVDWEGEEDEELISQSSAQSEHSQVIEKIDNSELVSGVESSVSENPEAGSMMENTNQQEIIEFIEIVESLPEWVDIPMTPSEGQEIYKTIKIPDADVKEAVTLSLLKEIPSTNGTLELKTAEPMAILDSQATELTQLESGEVHITITFDSPEKYKLNHAPAQDHVFNDPEPVNEQEMLENPKMPKIAEAEADCEPAIIMETDEEVEFEEISESNEVRTEIGEKKELIGSSEMVEGPEIEEEIHEDLEGPKMTRIHERYIELMRRTRNQSPLQPQF
ncbi:MAG: hypothetical protein ABFD08_02780 [Syntrophomonas sp.]